MCVPWRHVFTGIVLSVSLVCRTHGQSILTLAGGGTENGKPASLASIVVPGTIAFAENGDLFLLEQRDDGRVRRVDNDTGLLWLKDAGCDYSYDNDSNIFYGIFRDVEKDLFGSSHITFRVHMDESKRVNGVRVERGYTGL